MARILVIEDDPAAVALVRGLLAAAGHRVTTATSSRAGLCSYDQERFDLVILGTGTSDVDGWHVLAEIRDTPVMPVLMLTADDSEADRVRALRGGADDCLARPFGRDELVARVEALLRRSGGSRSRKFDDGFTLVDFDRRTLVVAGRPIALTRGEFDLLTALLRDPGVVITPSRLVDDGWDDDTADADRAKAAIHRLRKKIAAAGVEDYPIEAVRGVGYRYTGPPCPAQ